jgi:hypothetical protein
MTEQAARALTLVVDNLDALDTARRDAIKEQDNAQEEWGMAHGEARRKLEAVNDEYFVDPEDYTAAIAALVAARDAAEKAMAATEKATALCQMYDGIVLLATAE